MSTVSRRAVTSISSTGGSSRSAGAVAAPAPAGGTVVHMAVAGGGGGCGAPWAEPGVSASTGAGRVRNAVAGVTAGAADRTGSVSPGTASTPTPSVAGVVSFGAAGPHAGDRRG